MRNRAALAAICLSTVSFLHAAESSSASAPQSILALLANFGNVHATTTDAAGNLYLAGETWSSSFPTLKPLQSKPANPNWTEDGFVAKFDPTGTRMIYSTYIGGFWGDSVTGIAADAAGNAYLTGWTESGDFPVTDPSTPAQVKTPQHGFVMKISPDGSQIVYSHLVGGPNGPTQSNAISLDANGEAYIAGYTNGPDFPVIHAYQSKSSVHSLFASADGGATLQALDFGVPVQTVYQLRSDPHNTATLYAATSSGLFRSTNSGATWTSIYAGDVESVAIDPANSSILYLGPQNHDIAKSIDGGVTFTTLNSGSDTVTGLAIDPGNSSVLWAGVTGILRRSADGGQTWQVVIETTIAPVFPNGPITFIYPDPGNSQHVYACCTGTPGLLISQDNGQTWNPPSHAPTFVMQPAGIAVDPQNSSILYTIGGQALYRSADGGQSWTQLPAPPDLFASYSGIAVDNSEAVYVIAAGNHLMRSADGGQTWTALAVGAWSGPADFLGFQPGVPAAVYVGATGEMQDAFAAKLDPNGNVLWATLLGGSSIDAANAMALDGSGNLIVAGSTNSVDFPIANAFQPARAPLGNVAPAVTNGTDAFISKLSSDGSALLYSTYLGGNGEDAIAAIAVDTAGNAYLAGNTTSYTNSGFPVVNALQSSPADMFLAKLAPAGNSLVYCTYFGSATSVSSLALDPQGGVYFAGASRNPDLPTVNPFDSTGPAAYLAKLDPSGRSLDYATYLPLAPPGPSAIALAPSGSIWFGGQDSNGNTEGYYGRVDFLSAPAPGAPVVDAIVNSASYDISRTLAPGSIATIFGSALADGTQSASGTPLPLSMQSASVTVNGAAVPLFYVSAGQINFQVPSGVPLGSASVVVTHDSQSSVSQTIDIVAAAAAIFTQDGSGSGAGLIVHAADYSLVTASNPAQSGEYLVIFCTGLGVTATPVQSGSAATGPNSATSNVALQIQGANRPTQPILYAGLAPGYPGLYQVNFQMPKTSGGTPNVTLFVNGQASNTVTVAVP